MNSSRVVQIFALFWLCQQSGCALTGKGDVVAMRYFSPEQSALPHPAPSGQHFELQLGQVSSASHLDERIAYRLSASEMAFYDDRRWAELPEVYLRRALERELFEQRGLERLVSGTAPMLEVELTGFEELRGKNSKARVTLSFRLRDERRSLLERSINVEREVTEQAGRDPAERLAATLADTLNEAVLEVGAAVTAELAAASRSASVAAPQ